MSCYLRHLGKMLEKAGVTPSTKEERKMVDLTIRDIMGMSGGKCNEVWKELKPKLKEPGGEDYLIKELQERIK